MSTPIVQPPDLNAFGPWIGYVREHAYAIPTEDALQTIKQAAPGGVVEVGAGGGYWAQLLRDRGVDVLAFDLEPTSAGNAWFTREWGAVEQAHAGIAALYPERTLMLCWPPDDDPMAELALGAYMGGTLAFIGPMPPFAFSRVATSEFFDRLLGEWECVNDVELPQWKITPEIEMGDRLTIWRRVESP